MLSIASINVNRKMGIKDKRSNIKHGRYSNVLVLPASIEKGPKSTLAANRLILVDPRGEIDECDLLEFLEQYIDPQLWFWLRERKNKTFACQLDDLEIVKELKE